MSTKRPPHWKRKGYQNEAEYRAACAATRQTRKAALLATKSKGGHNRILRLMWEKADFDRPKVTIIREQIMSDLNCSLDTVKRAYRELRAEGSIKPVKNWKGGRGIPTDWLLCVPGRDVSPAESNIEAMKEARDRDAAWRFLKAKFGPMKALEILGDQDDQGDEN